MEIVTIDVKFTRDLTKLIDQLNKEVSGKGKCLEEIKYSKEGLLKGKIQVVLSDAPVKNHLTNAINKNKTSNYTGVYWNKAKNKWQWSIRHNNQRFTGTCKDELECALMYDAKAIELRGKNAVTNFSI